MKTHQTIVVDGVAFEPKEHLVYPVAYHAVDFPAMVFYTGQGNYRINDTNIVRKDLKEACELAIKHALDKYDADLRELEERANMPAMLRKLRERRLGLEDEIRS